MRYGEISKRFTNDEKTANLQDNNSGERPQRDNKDSVWKCNDFRYAPRDDYRREPRQAPRDLEKLQKPTEVYNKRRYEESFASSKLREAERKRETKKSVARKEEGVRVPEKSHDRLSALAKEPLKIASPSLQEARYTSSSPEHIRETPFRLSLQTRATGEQKLKGKLPDHCDAPGSEGGSSAIKKSQI